MNDAAAARSSEGQAPEGSPGAVFRIFLGLGLTSFGGPIAHLGYFREAFVVRRRWLDERAWADLVALCQFLCRVRPRARWASRSSSPGRVSRVPSPPARLHPALRAGAAGVRLGRRGLSRRDPARAPARARDRGRGGGGAGALGHGPEPRSRSAAGHARRARGRLAVAAACASRQLLPHERARLRRRSRRPAAPAVRGGASGMGRAGGVPRGLRRGAGGARARPQPCQGSTPRGTPAARASRAASPASARTKAVATVATAAAPPVLPSS